MKDDRLIDLAFHNPCLVAVLLRTCLTKRSKKLEDLKKVFDECNVALTGLQVQMLGKPMMLAL